LELVFACDNKENVLPQIHVSLAFILSLALVPKSMLYVEPDVPWNVITDCLNALSHQNLNTSRIEDSNFPRSENGTTHHLPEDYFIRGQSWSKVYHPPGFFSEKSSVDDEDRYLEPPSRAAPRLERCLWLGVRIASVRMSSLPPRK
jgi:hypothetical protein